MALGRPATLNDVPDAFLDDVASKGFTWIWFLGVWQTGPVGRAGLAVGHRSWWRSAGASSPTCASRT